MTFSVVQLEEVEPLEKGPFVTLPSVPHHMYKFIALLLHGKVKGKVLFQIGRIQSRERERHKQNTASKLDMARVICVRERIARDGE